MSFGSSAFGSTSYGGNANANDEQIFFSFPEPNRAPDILYEASARSSSPALYYEILTQQGSESASGPSGIEYKVYASHSEGETPQLQVTLGGNGRSIIGAAQTIVVTAIIDSAVWGIGTNFGVKGRPFTQ